MKVVFQDKQTGAMTVMTRMDPDSMIPAHYHTKADETVYVLSGQFIEDGEAYEQGAFFVGPAGTHHGPHTTEGGCVLLTTFSAELDFQVVTTGK
jgi:quercetin dioxygenase-like cupin family protein